MACIDETLHIKAVNASGIESIRAGCKTSFFTHPCKIKKDKNRMWWDDFIPSEELLQIKMNNFPLHQFAP